MSDLPNNQSPTDFAHDIVGREVYVTVHKREADGRKYREGSYNLFRPIIDEVLKKAGVADRKMAHVCEAAALACVGELMLASGFTIEYGQSFNPDEVVRVELRDDEPTYRDASVQRQVLDTPATNGVSGS